MSASSKILSLLDKEKNDANTQQDEAKLPDYKTFINSSPRFKVDEAKWSRHPSKVWRREKGKEEYTSLIGEIEKAKNFTWLEGIIVSDKFRSDIAAARTAPTPQYTDGKTVKYYLENIEEINDKIVLYEGEDKELGYATLARKEFVAKEVFGFYAGELLYTNEQYKGTYVYTLETDIIAKPIRKCAIDAENFGNMARFIPHLITPKNLAEAKLPPEIDKSKIATANMKFSQEIIEDIEISYIEVTKNIPAGQIAGLDYYHTYWKGKEFWLLDVYGEKILKVKYDENNIIVPAISPQPKLSLVEHEPPHVEVGRDKKKLKTSFRDNLFNSTPNLPSSSSVDELDNIYSYPFAS